MTGNIFDQTVNEEDHLKRLVRQARDLIRYHKYEIQKIEVDVAIYDSRLREINGNQ